MGHIIFEGETPQRLPTKEDNMLFKVLDLANEFFLAPFHFSLTLMIRFDSLPILRWRSDAALHKLITLSQELKYGKKGPWLVKQLHNKKEIFWDTKYAWLQNTDILSCGLLISLWQEEMQVINF